jgi:hypothetical protein
MFKNIYLITSIVVYIGYFIMRINLRINKLSKWSKYHFNEVNVKNADKNKYLEYNKKYYNKSECSDAYSKECINSGFETWEFTKSNIGYIFLRVVALLKPELYPLVLVDNSRHFIEHLLRLKAWGPSPVVLLFFIYHLICFSLDCYFNFFK